MTKNKFLSKRLACLLTTALISSNFLTSNVNAQVTLTGAGTAADLTNGVAVIMGANTLSVTSTTDALPFLTLGAITSSTGALSLLTTATASNTSLTVASFVATGAANVLVGITGTSDKTQTVNVTGNLTTTGTLGVTADAGDAAGTSRLNIRGNLTAGATTLTPGASTATLAFDGSSAQTVTAVINGNAANKGTVIAVTHDRYFLDNVAGWILELDRGEGIPWKGNYSSWLEQKSKRLESEEKTESKRQKTLERELEWVRMAPKARYAKSKARLSNYEKLASEDTKEREDKLELFIPPGPRLGNLVIEAQSVSKAFGDKILFDNLSFSLPPAGIVGIIGPNGAGKTTLFRLITGQDQPDAGSFRVGPTVALGYVDQNHDDLNPEKSVWENITEGNETIILGIRSINSRAYVSKFNFNGADQQKKVGVLSGGERNRVHLAITLKKSSNVLLLDEPTNDIDVNTLRALEEGLENFGGCAVIISHDRWFLDRVCTHILAFEGNSQVYYFEGNYSEYEENRKKRTGDITPHRLRYKKLTD